MPCANPIKGGSLVLIVSDATIPPEAQACHTGLDMRLKKPKPLFRPSGISGPTAKTGIPAHCETCGAIFAFAGIVGLREGAQVTFSNVGTNCPKCGGTANILDGTFEKTRDALRLLSGPQFTKDVLRAFGSLIEQATRKEITTEELQKQATEADAALGAVVAEALHSKFGLAALVILLLFLKT